MTDPLNIADSVSQMLDESYNQGLSHAISIAQQYLEMKSRYPDDSSEYNFTNLISRLEALKKKQP